MTRPTGKPRGRPARGDSAATERITVRFTPAALADVTGAANARGVTIAEFVASAAEIASAVLKPAP